MALFLFLAIDTQNEMTKLRMELPKLAKQVRMIQEENTRLQYQIDRFENPVHLMELAQNSRFSHLKHPLLDHILTLPSTLALYLPKDRSTTHSSRAHIVVGMKP